VGHTEKSMASKIFLILLPLPLSTSTTGLPNLAEELLLVGLRPGSTLQPGSTHLLTCSLPSPSKFQSPSKFTSLSPSNLSPSTSSSPSNIQLDFTWSVDSRLVWLDPSPLQTESHSASSWEYVPQTGDRVVQCSVAWREKNDQAEMDVKMSEEVEVKTTKVEVKTTKVEVKVGRKANKEDKAMVRLQREGSREERRGRRSKKEKRRRNNDGDILWIPFRYQDLREDLDMETQDVVEKVEEEEHLEERDIYLYMESQEMWRGGHRRLMQPPSIELYPVSLPLTMSSSSSSSSCSSFNHVFSMLMLLLIVRNFDS